MKITSNMFCLVLAFFIAQSMTTVGAFTLEVTARDFVMGFCNPDSNFRIKTLATLFDQGVEKVCWAPTIEMNGGGSFQYPIPFTSVTEAGSMNEYILVKAGDYEDSESDGYRVYPHPDFEGGVRGTTGFRNSAGASLQYPDESGIPKPNYVLANLPATTMEVLGDTNVNTDSITTSKEAFDAWYNDVPRVNKRVGNSVKLLEKTPGVFSYDDDIDSPEAIINKEQGIKDLTTDNGYEGFFGMLDGFDQSFNPFEAKTVWPAVSFEFRGNMKPRKRNAPYSLPHKFSFTTEIHTFFKYRVEDDLRLFGDDDIYIFVNGAVVAEKPGRGQNEAKIRMQDISPPLEVGKIYSLDIFQAERETTRSNMLFEVTLDQGCNIVTSVNRTTVSSLIVENSLIDVGSLASEGLDITGAYTNFAELANELQLNGAQLDQNTNGILLTSQADTNAWGQAWVKEKVHVSNGFDVSFHYRIDGSDDNASGNGFAFVMQNMGITNPPGGSGDKLGAEGLTGLVVALDLCADETNGTPQEPCSGFPTLRLEIDSQVVARAPVYFHLDDGKEHTMRVRYFGAPDWVEVLHDESLYLRATDVDLVSVLGSPSAFIGFTSGTSTNTADHLILSLSVQTMGVDVEKTVLVSGVYETQQRVVSADGEQSSTLEVRTIDNCGGQVTKGGSLSKFQGRIITDNGVEVDGEVVDKNDGSYELVFRTFTPGTYDLQLTFDGQRVCLEATNCSPFSGALTFAEFIAPTSSPTGHPVALPTIAPTGHPVAFPTSSPTGHPVALPTVPATQSPTGAPTSPGSSLPTLPSTQVADAGISNETWIGVGAGGAVFLCAVVVFSVVFTSRSKKKKRSDRFASFRTDSQHKEENDFEFKAKDLPTRFKTGGISLLSSSPTSEKVETTEQISEPQLSPYQSRGPQELMPTGSDEFEFAMTSRYSDDSNPEFFDVI